MCSCVGDVGFAPRAAYPIDGDITQLHAQFDTTASVKGFYAGANTEARRNEFIAGRLALYDLEYIRFISRFRLNRAAQSTAFDAVSLGVGFTTTIINGERAKTILGAVTTALTGARTSYEKNFYDDKTASALVSQMTAERKEALVPILQGLSGAVEEYPLTTAIIDLNNYQFAGSIDGALAGIQKQAAEKDAKATRKIDQFRTFAFNPDDATDRIKKWLWPNWASDVGGIFRDSSGNPVAMDSGRYAALQKELTKLNLSGVALPALLGNSLLADARASIVKSLSIP